MLIRLLLTLAVSATLLPAQSVEFLSDIRPLLSDNCFACHGPDEASRLAGIRLDVRDHAFSDTSNGTLIVEGNPEESLVYQRPERHFIECMLIMVQGQFISDYIPW